MATEREIDDALSIWGRSRGLLLHSNFRGKGATIRAKARAGLLERQSRLLAIIVTSLDA